MVTEENSKTMNTTIETFNNEDFGPLRSMMINEEPWFVGKDVADILGYSNSRKALIDHVDEEDKNTVTIRDGIPGNPNQIIINESGLYSLILSSKLPAAKKFKHWVTSEVLPSIRKKGYAVDRDHVLHSGNTITDPSTPLSREELALYFTYFVNGAKDFITSIDKRLDAMERGFEVITNVLTSSAEQSTKLENALCNALRTPVSVVNNRNAVTTTNVTSSPEVAIWLRKVWKSAAIISKKANGDSRVVLREIYKILRKDGVDLDSMYTEYSESHPGKAKINMIAESKMLRGKTEEIIKSLHRKYYPEKYTVENIVSPKPIYKSQELLSTPENVRSYIQAVADREGIVYTTAASKVYKEIEKRCGENLKELSKELARSYGCSNCSKAYLIAHNETLMVIIKAIAEGK